MRVSHASRIAEDLRLSEKGIRAVLDLLESGATVPFVARYRKEQTGGLDEVAIRAIEGKHAELAALEERRTTVLTTIDGQGKLTPQLRDAIEACRTRAELEDLYLPYRPKRKTRASAARERGLEPLALRILSQPPSGDPRAEAAKYVNPSKDVADVEGALAGARDIVAEVVSERSDVRGLVRARFDREALVESTAIKAKTKQPTKFEAYYEFTERARTVPSHRLLAILRGENEGVLRVRIRVDDDALARELVSRAGVRKIHRSPASSKKPSTMR